jgi:hypothetical protein
MSLQSALDLALETIQFPRDHVLYRYGRWRLRLVGPWRFPDGTKWQAIAEPHNATGHDLNQDIEGVGDTPEEALLSLVTKIHRAPRSKTPKKAEFGCSCGHPWHPGLVCGYPLKDPVFVGEKNCECEG